MNKAGSRTAYYYLTSVGSMPKQRNTRNSWNSFLSFAIITQHKLYKSATSGFANPCPTDQISHSHFFFCIERPSLRCLIHFFLFPCVQPELSLQT